MLIQTKFSFLILLIAVLILPYCGKIEKIPETPSIKYISNREVDTVDALGNPAKRIDIEIYLIDGDGNIGLFSYDTVSPNDTSKFYIKEYRKKNGIFVEEIYEQPLHNRLPYLQPIGQDKTLRCTIKVEISYNEPQLAVMDSLRYELFIVDRSLKKSNVITTPEIIVSN